MTEGASSSSSSGQLAWDVEKNLMLQFASDHEWHFAPDVRADEDLELRLALEMSLADVSDSSH